VYFRFVVFQIQQFHVSPSVEIESFSTLASSI